MQEAVQPSVRISTEMGDFVVSVDLVRAPVSAGNFLSYVDSGLLDNTSVYRIVSMANQPAATTHKIEVIQFGWRGSEGEEPPLPRIAHEPTTVSHLRHVDGTLSTGRKEPGSGGASFFICIGDWPSLDFGGGRNPDGQGFGAFGRVIEGMDVVRRIFARAEESDQMKHPVAIVKAVRLAG
jgi:peptidyl-prolyl cis-trans isomerase A (cyclophilin A)